MKQTVSLNYIHFIHHKTSHKQVYKTYQVLVVNTSIELIFHMIWSSGEKLADWTNDLSTDGAFWAQMP